MPLSPPLSSSRRREHPARREAMKADEIEVLAKDAMADACFPGNPREATLDDVIELFKKICPGCLASFGVLSPVGVWSFDLPLAPAARSAAGLLCCVDAPRWAKPRHTAAADRWCTSQRAFLGVFSKLLKMHNVLNGP